MSRCAHFTVNTMHERVCPTRPNIAQRAIMNSSDASIPSCLIKNKFNKFILRYNCGKCLL